MKKRFFCIGNFLYCQPFRSEKGQHIVLRFSRKKPLSFSQEKAAATFTETTNIALLLRTASLNENDYAVEPNDTRVFLVNGDNTQLNIFWAVGVIISSIKKGEPLYLPSFQIGLN